MYHTNTKYSIIADAIPSLPGGQKNSVTCKERDINPPSLAGWYVEEERTKT